MSTNCRPTFFGTCRNCGSTPKINCCPLGCQIPQGALDVAYHIVGPLGIVLANGTTTSTFDGSGGPTVFTWTSACVNWCTGSVSRPTKVIFVMTATISGGACSLDCAVYMNATNPFACPTVPTDFVCDFGVTSLACSPLSIVFNVGTINIGSPCDRLVTNCVVSNQIISGTLTFSSTETVPVCTVPCGACDLPFEDLTLSYVNTIAGNGTVTLVPGGGTTWTSACVKIGSTSWYQFTWSCISGTMVLSVSKYSTSGCLTPSNTCASNSSSSTKLITVSTSCSPLDYEYSVGPYPALPSCGYLSVDGFTTFEITP